MARRKVHMMQYVLGMPDFIGDKHSIICTQYAVRLCDEKPAGEMTEQWSQVTCRRCLKRRKVLNRGTK